MNEEVTRSVSLQEISEILNSTIKHDEQNKLITFLSMLLTYTEEDQLNISFNAEASTGKSHIPLEIAWYFPKQDIKEYAYTSPTSFFHEYGVSMIKDKQKIMVIDLHRKILIFLDQPHDMLLQRLRSLLSHDRKQLTFKITDKHEKSGLRTKTVVIEGFPTVVFCSAKFSMEEQERTRLLMLSPETTQEKIRDAIALRIKKDSNREAFHKFMEEDQKRVWLKKRVHAIADSQIKSVIIPEELGIKIKEKFFSSHNSLVPRHQRDIVRLLGLIKAHALLNLWSRKREGDAIIVDESDVRQGFNLYGKVSEANEYGLPPEIYDIFLRLKSALNDREDGLTRKDFQQLYYEMFFKPIGTKRLEELLSVLKNVGLLVEEQNPSDRRQKLFTLVGPKTSKNVYEESEEVDQHGY